MLMVALLVGKAVGARRCSGALVSGMSVLARTLRPAAGNPCPLPPSPPSAVCDFRTIRKYALPGTDCLGKRCVGSLTKKPDEE